MSSLRCILGLSLLAGLLCLLSSPGFAAQRKLAHKPAAKQQPVTPPPAVEPPVAPPTPLTLAQKPAVPPRVEYRDGQLAIVAENSTLGDVLRAVRQQTGAVVDIPANATERVVTHLGPGPPRDVVAKLLDGTSFNFVILGSPTDATAVKRVIVSPKPGGTEVASAGNPNLGGSQPRPQGAFPTTRTMPPPQADDAPEPDTPADEATEDDSQADDQQDEQNPEGQAQPAPGTAPVIKTPEQLLQELQRQQQQQQQGQPPMSRPQGFPVPPNMPQPPDQNAPQPE